MFAFPTTLGGRESGWCLFDSHHKAVVLICPPRSQF